MKNIIRKITFILASVVVAAFNSSCDALLDQDETDFGKGPIVVQFPDAAISSNFLQDGSGAVYAYEVPIEYFGEDGLPLDKDVTFSIAVDATSSTAVEGTEFSLDQTEFTIPAGSNTASAVIMVNSANLDSNDPKEAVIQIVSSSETVSSNKNKIAITLQAICPSNLEGTYRYLNGVDREVTITSTGTGTYTVSADNAFTSEYSFNISDICNSLTVTGGFLDDNFGIGVSGTGSVDPDTGTITIYYTADGYLDNREMILEKL
ncbi:hypothetical protein HZY62_02795 [Maribacter polysiphoniae]|uniref:Calx-beta domain-containing protein n=1 Tax=Maribacter polysiphoniae TaxID=429344 RepID=A0A316E2Z7_9FLAO|nr:hypothetical protein [Maribacter polysiphoniae]MBD1259502.1 hypothetical protein [Maribacter polysiphoniae]PWK25067.1 hypothetical protein LX92_01436 [Maribacter polysiphoniae]